MGDFIALHNKFLDEQLEIMEELADRVDKLLYLKYLELELESGIEREKYGDCSFSFVVAYVIFFALIFI